MTQPPGPLCLLLAAAFAVSAQPPDLAKRVAQREADAARARDQYTYRQTVTIDEAASKGGRPGQYKEVREVVFSSGGERTERTVGRPIQNLARLILTEEDFRDIREVQPFLFLPERLWMYQTKFKGDDNADGIDCWLLHVSPRQTFPGQRLFEGMFWVDKRDFSVIKSEGVAVPKILSKKQENLFPRFTTFRRQFDGHWFPVHTFSDDTLEFSSGPIRQRMSIRYEEYKRFNATSTVTFQ
ncbi:MAG: hypothetical protein U0Q16_05760 [Bryobacteraceae bacterium]